MTPEQKRVRKAKQDRYNEAVRGLAQNGVWDVDFAKLWHEMVGPEEPEEAPKVES